MRLIRETINGEQFTFKSDKSLDEEERAEEVERKVREKVAEKIALSTPREKISYVESNDIDVFEIRFAEEATAKLAVSLLESENNRDREQRAYHLSVEQQRST